MDALEITALVVPLSVLGIFITRAVLQYSVLKRKNGQEDSLLTKQQAHELIFYEKKKDHEISLLGKKNEHEMKITEMKYTHEITILDKNHLQSNKLAGR